MNVVMVALNFKPATGGIAEYTHQVVRTLAGLGHRVRVVAPEMPGADDFDASVPYEVARIDLDLSPPPLRALPAVVRHLRHHVAEVDADWLVHNTIDGATHACWWVGVRDRIPVCTMVHGTDVQSRMFEDPSAYDHALSWLVERSRLKRGVLQADHVTSPSTYTRDLLIEFGVPHDRVTVIPPFRPDPEAADVAEEAVRAVREDLGIDDAPMLLTLTRLVERKGIDVVLEALPAIREAIPDVRYVVAGDGPDRDRLESLAGEHDVGDAVTFAGFVEEDRKWTLLAAADLFVMPNRKLPDGDVEGFGIVFLEANMVGTPVVGGRSGGAVDAIADGETGLLVDPRDVEGLADRIVELLSDDDRRQRMASEGLKRTSRWRDLEAGVAELADRFEAGPATL